MDSLYWELKIMTTVDKLASTETYVDPLRAWGERGYRLGT